MILPCSQERFLRRHEEHHSWRSSSVSFCVCVCFFLRPCTSFSSKVNAMQFRYKGILVPSSCLATCAKDVDDREWWLRQKIKHKPKTNELTDYMNENKASLTISFLFFPAEGRGHRSMSHYLLFSITVMSGETELAVFDNKQRPKRRRNTQIQNVRKKEEEDEGEEEEKSTGLDDVKA